MAGIDRVQWRNTSQPIVIFLFCGLLAVFSGWILTDQRHSNLRLILKKHAEVSSHYITNDLESRIPALRRIVYRWEKQNHYTKRGFQSDARHYIHDIPGFQSINWVDESGQVRWVAPTQGNEGLENKNLAVSDSQKHFFSELKNRTEPTIAIEPELHANSLSLYFPIRVKGKFQGYLLAVIKAEEWLNYVFHRDRFEDDVEDYDVAVRLSGNIIYQTENYNDPGDSQWNLNSDTEILGHTLVVSVQPTVHFFTHGNQFTAELVMIVFVLFGTILASFSYYYKKVAKMSQQARLANKVLAKESKERQRAEKEAVTANNAKTKFLAAMSHEIRTPLNGVLGILQLLKQEKLATDVHDKLDIARESGFFLLTLVNQVLDFARIESGSVERNDAEFRVEGLISELHSMFKMQAHQKGLLFDYKILGPKDKWLNGDYSHIKQILFNLIGNAIKFTDHGAVTIVAKIIENPENRVSLSFEVVDTGPGISPEEQKMIFEEFKQSETGRKSGMGTGLGLSISKQLADVMEGHLSVSSTLGHGTTFTLTVGVNIVEETSRPHKSDFPLQDLRPLNILVADDNTVNQMIIEEMLLADRHTVTIVNDGASAVREIQENSHHYDLVLMDIQMPRMNGIEATKAIRNLMPNSAKLPILALTANAFKSQIEHYLSVGMQGVLTKPVVQSELRATLARLFAVSSRNSLKSAAKPSNLTVQKQSDYFDRHVMEKLAAIMSEEKFVLMLDALHDSISKGVTKITERDITPKDVSERAHALLGLALNTGLTQMSERAMEIEKLAKTGVDTYQMRLHLEEVARESMKELSEYCAMICPR